MEEKFNDDQNQGGRVQRRNSSSVWVPIVMILAGIFILLQQLGQFSLHNWWALFILIPAFSTFGTAFALWSNKGRFSIAVWSTFYGGLYPLLVACMFLFNLDWGIYWPLFVILGGFGMFISGLPFKQNDSVQTIKSVRLHWPWPLFIGLAATLFGLTFLMFNLGTIVSFPYLDIQNWWGLYIMLASLGGLFTALLLLFKRKSLLLVLSNLSFFGIVFFTGYVAINQLDWDMIKLGGPIMFIVIGIGILLQAIAEKRQE